MTAGGSPPSVAIVGGGFSGAAVAFHLARGGWPAPIMIFEPRPVPGAGLAYSTTDPAHRINVPATRMGLLPDENPAHFADWLEAGHALDDDPAATLADGRRFPARALFGRYVAEQLGPWLRSGTIVHHRDAIAAVDPDGAYWRLVTASGARHAADILVLAVSHPPPTLPRPLVAVADHPALVADPWAPAVLETIAADARVLIVGTGLTMADVVATLDRRGHRGDVLAVSRRGQRSRGHAEGPVEEEGEFADPPAASTVALLRRIRAAVADAADRGHGWQAVLDRVRTQAPAIWQALPAPQQARLVRHLRPYWDTHRFRIAPPVEDAIDRLTARGRLRFEAARILSAGVAGDRIVVEWRDRRGIPARAAFDAVINTTGPGHAALLQASPLLAGLAARDMIRPGPLGLGLLVDADSRALGGAANPPFVAGPLARERFGELMGLPEVARHAQRVADRVAAMT